MPIRARYEHFEFPKNMDLPVHAELPEGFTKRELWPWEATNTELCMSQGNRLQSPEQRTRLAYMTKCHHCRGWVSGQAYEHRVNNLDGAHLAGRRGTEYYCPRCAREIHFSGMMS